MKEKVLFLQKTFELGGGIEKVHSNLAAGFVASEQNVFFHIISASAEHSGGIKKLAQSFSVSFTFDNDSLNRKLLVLFKLIRQEEITSVIAATETANMLAILCKIRFPSLKIIFTRHCAFDVSGQKLGPRAIKSLYSIYPWFGRVVAVSRELVTQMKRQTWIHKSRLHYIPNAAATQENQALAQQNTEHWPHKQYFLAIGRLVEQKGFDMLITAYSLAVNKNKNLPSLVIAGQGEDEAKLKALVSELKLEEHVTFAGFLRNPYYPMAQAECFVLSSRHEGMPTVLIEALSLGTACIAFDCPTGPSEIIRHNENGFLVENGDIDALADALSNYQSAPKTGLVESVAEFSQSSVCQHYLKLLGGKANV